MAGPQQVAQQMSQPDQLQEPVPGEAQSQAIELQQSQIADDLTDNPFMQVLQEADPEFASSMADQTRQLQAGARENTLMDQAGLDPTTGEPTQQTFSEANFSVEGIKEQLNEAIPRAKLSFAVGPRETLEYAQKLYPNKKVELIDGDLAINGKKLDEDTVELIADAADGARDIFEALIEGTGKIGGGMLGAAEGAAVGAGAGLVAGPGAVVASPLGAASGGFLGGIAGASVAGAGAAVGALHAGDAIAAGLGIDRDPDRSRFTESAVTAGLGGLFGFMGARSARIKESRRLTGEAFSVSAADATKDINKAKESVEMLRQSGLIKRGDEFKLLPGQVVGKSTDLLPELGALEQELSSNLKFRNFVRQQGETIADAYESFTRAIGGLSGNVRLNQEGNVVGTLVDMTRAEGKHIGSFRDAALQATKVQGKAQPQQVNRTVDALRNFTQELNVASMQELQALKPRQIKAIFPELSTEQAETLLDNVVTIAKKLDSSQGGMSLSDLDKTYTSLRGQIDVLYESSTGRGLAKRLIKIKDALRDDWTEAIGNNLGPEQREAYEKSLNKFSELRKSMKELGSMVKDEDISRQAFAKQVFTQGKKGLPALKNIRKIMQSEDPDLYNQFVADYFDQLRLKHYDDARGIINWSAMRKEYKKLGSEFHRELYKGTNMDEKVAEALFRVGDIFNRAKANFSHDNKTLNKGLLANAKRFALIVLPSLFTTKVDQAAQIIKSAGGQDNALAKYLNAGALEDVIDFIPQAQRPGFLTRGREIVETALGYGREELEGRGAKKAAQALTNAVGQQSQTVQRRNVQEFEVEQRSKGRRR